MRGGAAYFLIMHGRSRVNRDSRIPTKPGRVSHRPNQTLLAPRAKRREVSGESQEG